MEGMASPGGAVTLKLIETMAALAEGGVGLIITGHAYVRTDGQANPGQIGIYSDDLLDGLRKLTSSVHEKGGKIVVQLSHAGRYATEELIGQPPLVVSDFEGLAQSPRRQLTIQDIGEIVSAFADASRRARLAGFDGVQIHGAHGYLLSQFLSPAFNRRQDAYGGDAVNRARIHLEVYRAVRETVGKGYPVLIKMNSRDFVENGLELADFLRGVGPLVHEGIDAVEMSGGMQTSGKLSPSRPGISTEDKEAYFREEALAFKKQYDVPVILVGGIRSFTVAEGLIEEGTADYISMSRPFIREPGLVNRWKSGDRSRATCISDNRCFLAAREGGIYCVVDKKEKTA
jgi:2,4-dienoyl-CoA reductase-like NADH-dependent reductase (Old Yellow Enzyme family)